MQIIREILLQYSGLICAIVGAVTAWGLAELSRHFANTYQKKQTLNRALSLMLELYFQIRRIANACDQSQDFVKWYENLLSQYSVPQEVKEVIGGIIRGKVTPNDNLFVLRGEIIDLSKSTSFKQRNEILITLNNIDAPDASAEQYFDTLKGQVSTALENAL